MQCDCREFKENTKILDGIIDIYANLSYGNPRGYVGKPFVYCPWCSKKLTEEIEANLIPSVKGKILG